MIEKVPYERLNENAASYGGAFRVLRGLSKGNESTWPMATLPG